MTAPIEATALDGVVWIKTDPTTARDLSEAWSLTHATCEDLEADRPHWMRDVVTLATAAMKADLQNGDGAEVVPVPLLRVVGGGVA